MDNYYLGSGKRWNFAELSSESFHSTNIPQLIYNILFQRDVRSEEEVISFLNPTLKSLHDPFLLDGMEIAVERIIRAIQNNEKVLIYGDYDVDGVAATSILIRFFKTQHIEIDYYIPDRLDEGYGISDIAVKYIVDNSYDLVITVDCGITACNQIEDIYRGYAKKGKTIDIIVTDHHQCNEKLMPQALVVIDPHIPQCNYPYRNLCGAGIALKLIQAICNRLDISDSYMEYLDLAALATIADIVELRGENRILTKYGIEKISSNPSMGIKALIKTSELSNIDSHRLSFTLAPRVNAAGRMGDARLAIDLFTTDDEKKAEKIALLLNQSNIKRKAIQEEIYNSAIKTIEANPRFKKDKILVVWGEGYHHGVIGIVASKLVDYYHKPAIILSTDNGKAVGSARSIEGFNLYNAMEAVSDILVKFGGHEQAGGLTLKTEDLELFSNRINAYAAEHITEDMLIPTIKIHLTLTGRDISLDTAKLITRLEPFGCGNQNPVFCLRETVLVNKRVIGNGKHLKLCFNIDGQLVDAVYFGKGYLADGLFEGDIVDIIFTQEVNVWQNTESLQIKVLDMRLSEMKLKKNRLLLNSIHQTECLDSDVNWLYNGIIDKLIDYDDILINRDDLALIYKYIIRMKSKPLSLVDLFVHSRIIEKGTKRNINCFKFFVGLLIFEELRLLELVLNTDDTYNIILSDNVQKVDLGDSEILNWVKQAANGFKS